MKKIIAILILLITALFLIFNLFDKRVFANTSCEKVTDTIKYFNATLYNYNAMNYNSWARGYSLNDFNQLSEEERISIDSQHTLLGDIGFKSTWLWQNIGCIDLIYGGWQNGIQKVEKINEKVSLYTVDAVKQNLVQNKLINDNIVLTYKNNNVELFPNQKQAEAKDLVGENKPYREILRDYQMPFIKEGSGYYFFDSNEYHLKRGKDNRFELHKGTAGSLSQWNTREIGLFPFNKECYTSSETNEHNELFYGMRLDIPFYMPESGKSLNHETNRLEDMIFDFRGDDDVWVFVDDSLVLDLGGGHKAIGGNINFSKNMSYVEATVNQDNIVTNDVYINNLFGEKLLEEGQHILKIFYLERFRRNIKL